MALTAPELVPVNNIRPELERTTWVSITSGPTFTWRTIWGWGQIMNNDECTTLFLFAMYMQYRTDCPYMSSLFLLHVDNNWYKIRILIACRHKMQCRCASTMYACTVCYLRLSRAGWSPWGFDQSQRQRLSWGQKWWLERCSCSLWVHSHSLSCKPGHSTRRWPRPNCNW